MERGLRKFKYLLIFISSVFIIFSIASVSSDCADEDRIMKLYSSTNSHGALWNDVSYTYDICYSQIFGSVYNGANPHFCIGTNKVLGLYQESNSHAEIPSLDNYNISVCYGDLECRAVTEPTACASDEKVVVRLFQNTNSHISNAEDTNYPIKICCKPSGKYNAYWANMMDEQINSTDIGDLVKLYVAGSGISGEINYTIWKDIPWWFDKKIAQTSSYGYTNWRAGLNIEDDDLEDGDYYFKAKLTNGNEVQSGTLTVTSPGVNFNPRVKIISPAVDEKFRKGVSTVNFRAEFEDEDDDLKAVWSFGDGSSVIKSNCLTGTDCNVDYIYDTQGAFVVTLTVEEIGRDQKATDYTRVLIYDEGLNLFSLIDEPEFGKRFSEKGLVFFSANRSYVAKCTTFGICTLPPPPTGGSEITECYDVKDLTCYNYPKDWISKIGGYEFHFSWIFSEGEPRTGKWSEDYSEVVEFSRLFIVPKEEGHWAKLKVGYEAL